MVRLIGLFLKTLEGDTSFSCVLSTAYCTLKANWKVGSKGTSDTGLQVSTSIHSRGTSQRQQRILGGGSEASLHLSALGNSSSDWDTNASISHRHTHTDTHTHNGANEVQ